jgi:predicted membrane-bound dolichyl-phosphate-mannose-protein mannosyltransferase
VKNKLFRIYRWQYFWLSVVVIATLAAHFSTILNPNDLVLDEQHYVKDARSIIETHVDQRPEHPALAKLFIVGGIDALGDNQWGWRVPSILMGTLGIIFLFFICRRLKMSLLAANLTTFLFGFENITFLHASVAMLDVFYVTLMLAAFLLYLCREYITSGIFIGLSALAKLYAALGTPAIFFHWVFSKNKHSWWFIATIVLAPLSFVLLMPLFDYALTHQFLNPISRIKEMLSLSESLTFANVTHPALARPWSWVVNYIPMAYWYSPHYTAAVSFTVWAAIIPIVLYLLYRAVKRNEAGLFGFAWFFGTYVVWIPISIITDRVSFVYYFYPTVGAFCLGLGAAFSEILGWAKLKTSRVRVTVTALVIAFLVLHFVAFVILTPVFLRS